jgi:hypothetical protein
MMKNVPCIVAAIAALATIVAVIAKLSGALPMGISARGMLMFAMVMLLFGINHSLCKRCMEEKK